MISHETAKNLSTVIREIKECKSALSLLHNGMVPNGTFIHVEKSEEDNFWFPIAPELATETLKNYLAHLEVDYSALNKKAIEEANHNEQE